MLVGNRVLRIVYHQEDEGWWATCPEEPSLFIIGGASYEEATERVREGLDDMGLGYRALLHIHPSQDERVFVAPTA